MIDHEKNESLKINDENSNDSNEKMTNLSKRTLSDAEILSQCVLFLAAGYETTATSLSFIAYNLATNAKCQEKLIEEIDRVAEKYVR